MMNWYNSSFTRKKSFLEKVISFSIIFFRVSNRFLSILAFRLSWIATTFYCQKTSFLQVHAMNTQNEHMVQFMFKHFAYWHD